MTHTPQNVQRFDVIIIGAGLSGIGAGVHLQKLCPGTSYTILEMRDAIGGTWDLFRYPGIRSDSDMYTLGYRFKPWSKKQAIADGGDILSYIRETASSYGVEQQIRYRHRVVSLDWSSRAARWTICVENLETGEELTFESQFVLNCSGYYKYDHGYTPEFPGREAFAGPVIHPQRWPEDLDYAGKRIVVIGSGATAVTLVPALAERAAHVTMLQRSPSYVISVGKNGSILNGLRRFLPEKIVYTIARAGRVLLGMGFYEFTRAYPKRARTFLQSQVARAVGETVDMKHFTPKYDPWDERLCAVPDGDLFAALRSGRASVVTGQIERFTERGIALKSGEEVPADIVITATGLQLQILGGAALTLDGELVNIAEKLYYKGAMLEDVPNLAVIFGYTNSSWTLKADLILEYFCRVINHMNARGVAQCTPRNIHGVASSGPFLDLSSGYVRRALHMLPRQGKASPWKLYQNYLKDVVLFKLRRLDDGQLVFSNPVAHRYGYRKAADEPDQAAAAS